MSLIATESLNKVMDAFVSAYIRADGLASSGYGLGESGDSYGCADKLGDLDTIVLETGDIDVISHLAGSIARAKTNLGTLRVFGRDGRTIFAALNNHAAKQSNANYSTLETLLGYLNYNGGGTWAALQDYRWRDVYNAFRGGSRYPEPANLYFEVLKDATYANALRSRVVGGAHTAGASIDSAKYAGGVPCVYVENFAGASDTVTVTGTFFDPATNAVETGKTATFTVDGNGTFYRVGGNAAANALIISSSDITIGASITASTAVYAQAERPALRSGTCGADVVSATTVGLDDSASAIDDFYVGYEIATNADRYTKRTISAYNGTTKVATVSVAWGTNPTASTSTFRIFRPALPN